ncbi:MAG: PxxKW family cysteine-rich protein [Deferrisomatales bacterium]
MLCQTVKKDKDCFFWAAQGCTFPGGECRSVAEKCEGCGRVEQWPTGQYCSSYPAPQRQWNLGLCNMATHIKIEEDKVQKMLNPLKASKRAAGKKR